MIRQRTPRRPRWFVITLLVILGYFGSMIVSQGFYLSHVYEDQRLASERLTAAQAENDRLRAEKERLGELPYIEKLAREELGMTGAGELPYAPGKRSNGN
ncbi:septum formation inhibitor MinC [Selenomonas sp. oral taxon 126]|uniref:FtsB family cell division protein n=1 Tax=Selenomonas sp. oral taxon 126 TaxID=712528 RepID=UPI00080791D5|nr:septum formation initiator family protein [Selenomonas sp. oral taxon 126]ANR71951.1 septum formation inhibitor MinC [Selenomonas sp. oral taxon 126]